MFAGFSSFKIFKSCFVLLPGLHEVFPDATANESPLYASPPLALPSSTAFVALFVLPFQLSA